MAANFTNSADGAALRLSFVGGRSVNCGNRLVVKPKIHREVSAMMRQVIEGVTDHDVARRLLQHVTSSEQLPVLRQMIVGGVLQRLAAFRDGIVERGRQFLASVRLWRAETPAGWTDI